MYVVRFVRKDGQPDEEYYYSKAKDALNHMKMFVKDDSGLYQKIQLNFLEDREIIVTQLVF